MYIALMMTATDFLRNGNHDAALHALRDALPLAQQGRQWSMTMKAIRFTLRAINANL